MVSGQRVIKIPRRLWLRLKQHLAATQRRSRRAGSCQSYLKLPLLSASTQHSNGGGGLRGRRPGWAERPCPAPCPGLAPVPVSPAANLGAACGGHRGACPALSQLAGLGGAFCRSKHREEQPLRWAVQQSGVKWQREHREGRLLPHGETWRALGTSPRAPERERNARLTPSSVLCRRHPLRLLLQSRPPPSSSAAAMQKAASKMPPGAGSAASQGLQRRGQHTAQTGGPLRAQGQPPAHPTGLDFWHLAPGRTRRGARPSPTPAVGPLGAAESTLQASRAPQPRGRGPKQAAPPSQGGLCPSLILIEGDKQPCTEEVAPHTAVRSH